MSDDTLNLSKTKLAIEAYDKLCEANQKRWDNVNTDAEVHKLVAEEEAARVVIAEAFASETSDRNSRNSALVVRPDRWLRELVAKYGGPPTITKTACSKCEGKFENGHAVVVHLNENFCMPCAMHGAAPEGGVTLVYKEPRA